MTATDSRIISPDSGLIYVPQFLTPEQQHDAIAKDCAATSGAPRSTMADATAAAPGP